MAENTSGETQGSGDVQLQAVQSVKWTDDDGQQYKRVFTDDGIEDIPIEEVS